MTAISYLIALSIFPIFGRSLNVTWHDCNLWSPKDAISNTASNRCLRSQISLFCVLFMRALVLNHSHTKSLGELIKISITGSILSSVQLFSHVQLFAAPWTAAHQASLSITNSQSLLKLMSITSVMPSNHLILFTCFSSCPQSFPAPGFFPMSQFFTLGGQSIGVSASASVLPMNIQDWFLLGWTGWISFQSRELSRVFSNTTVQKHQFFGAQLSL